MADDDDDGRQATISMTDGTYQAQIDAVEAEQEREQQEQEAIDSADYNRSLREKQRRTAGLDAEEMADERNDVSPSVGSIDSFGVSAENYDASDIAGKTIRTSTKSSGTMQKMVPRMESPELPNGASSTGTYGFMSTDSDTGGYFIETPVSRARQAAKPIGVGMAKGFNLGGGMAKGSTPGGGAFKLNLFSTNKTRNTQEYRMTPVKKQPSPINWNKRAGLDSGGSPVSGIMGNLFGRTRAQPTPRKKGVVGSAQKDRLVASPTGGSPIPRISVDSFNFQINSEKIKTKVATTNSKKGRKSPAPPSSELNYIEQLNSTKNKPSIGSIKEFGISKFGMGDHTTPPNEDMSIPTSLVQDRKGNVWGVTVPVDKRRKTPAKIREESIAEIEKANFPNDVKADALKRADKVYERNMVKYRSMQIEKNEDNFTLDRINYRKDIRMIKESGRQKKESEASINANVQAFKDKMISKHESLRGATQPPSKEGKQRSVSGVAQTVSPKIRAFLGFTQDQKINKTMLENAWKPHIESEHERVESERIGQLGTQMQFETLMGHVEKRGKQKISEQIAQADKERKEEGYFDFISAGYETAKANEEREDRKRILGKIRAKAKITDADTDSINKAWDSMQDFGVTHARAKDLAESTTKAKAKVKEDERVAGNIRTRDIFRKQVEADEAIEDEAWKKGRTGEQVFWDVFNNKKYDTDMRKKAAGVKPKSLVSDDWKERHPLATGFGALIKQDVRRPFDDLLAGRAARGNPQTNRGFLYGGGLQPVNITKANPVGEFPRKSGRPAKPRRKDPVGGRELAFFGKPFGAPKAPRRTRRGRIIKMTAAERKRASRKPKSFLDEVFGARW